MDTSIKKKKKTNRELLVPTICMIVLSIGVSVILWLTVGWKVCALYIGGAGLFALVKLLRDFSLAPHRLINIIYTALVFIGPVILAILTVVLVC